MGRIFEVRKHAMFARWNRMAKQFTRVAKDIAIAVHAGGADPASNPTLRRVLQNARAVNMPKDKTDAAIRRASGKDAANYTEILYEGYAPHGVALLVETAEALALLARAGILPARLTPIPPAWMPRVLGIPDAWFARLGRAMLSIDPLARSSMSDDLDAGRATEIDWINGEVVKLAQRVGQMAPVNGRLCELVQQAERSDVRPSWAGEALLAELRAAAAGTSARDQSMPE